MTRAEWRAWTQGLRRGADALAAAIHAAGARALTDDLDAQFFTIWRETIHDCFRTHAEYDCTRWCWLRQSREEQLARFHGRLSFSWFRQLFVDALDVHCERAASPAAAKT